jgi:hypothetical protein
MLPEYPRFMKDFDAAITRFMRARSEEHEAFLSGVQHRQVFEGSATKMIRADGTSDDTPFIDASSHLEISFDKLHNIQLSELLLLLEQTVIDLANKKAQYFFSTLETEAEKSGTAIHSQGAPFTAELYLDLLQRMWIDFNEDGSPRFPTSILAPAVMEKARSELRRLAEEPALRQRMSQLLSQKREQWRAREALRELA